MRCRPLMRFLCKWILSRSMWDLIVPHRCWMLSAGFHPAGSSSIPGRKTNNWPLRLKHPGSTWKRPVRWSCWLRGNFNEGLDLFQLTVRVMYPQLEKKYFPDCQSERCPLKTVPRYAGVAELADAPDSKSGSRKGVWVRLPPSVPFFSESSGQTLGSSRISAHPRWGSEAVKRIRL